MKLCVFLNMISMDFTYIDYASSSSYAIYETKVGYQIA